MRRLRIVIRSVGGAVPVLAATVLVPAADACGGEQVCATVDATADGPTKDTGASDDGPIIFQETGPPDTGPGDTGVQPLTCPQGPLLTHIVSVPMPGVPADQGQLCAIAMPPAKSNVSARVSLTQYDPMKETAWGAISVPFTIANLIVGTPTISVVSASSPEMSMLAVSNVKKTNGGYTFDASWPKALPRSVYGQGMVVKVTFTLSCGDGGTQTVEAQHSIELCVDGDTFGWVSSGDACTVCTVIAEMAPSPIVSDNRGDELPLARHLRLRVVELARAGRDVLLIAENDGGETAEYEWRVSGGKVEHVAPDIVLWTLPEEGERLFGQVAVWNDTGAAVENFLWGAA